jgi:hypothetical protein
MEQEVFMERRKFLSLAFIGASVSLLAKPARALTAAAALRSPEPALGRQPGVATSEEIDEAKTEKAYYGHWRRVGRRRYRRVSRRVYRRRYYY